MSTQQRHRIIIDLKPLLSFFIADNDKRFSLQFASGSHGALSGGLYVDKELGSDLVGAYFMNVHRQIY